MRAWLKSENEPLTPETELLLFAAARAELVRTVIKPALASGTHVLLDRYADSTTAYQGYGRRLPIAHVRSANAIASAGVVPDVTILLDAPLDITLGRTVGRQDDGGRRFEDESLAFHRRVKAGFLRLAKHSPERWTIVNAVEDIGLVHEAIWKRVQGLLTR